MADDCLPTNQVPLVPSLNPDDTILINDGGAIDGTVAQVPVTALSSNPPAHVVFTASGVFTPGDYPGLRAVRVRAVGGGGGGGGAAATTSGEAAAGGGGAGGNGAESFILAASLGVTETVTVGAGGTAVAGGDGGNGGDSAFGAHVVAPGGRGGSAGVAFNGGSSGAGGSNAAAPPGIGDLLPIGDSGQNARYVDGDLTSYANGGASAWGMGGGGATIPAAAGTDGEPGLQYGGGGSGGMNRAPTAQPARAGGVGAAGVVVVELFT